MTEVAPAAAPAAAPTAISATQGAQMLAEKRAATQGKTDLSAHASALGKAAAEARKARTTEAQAQPEAPEAGEPEQDDETQGHAEGETLNDETASNEPSDETNTESKDEPAEGQMIDLGEGVKVTLDQVRDGFMLKADHTRKTQALSEERKAFENIRTQKVAQLDTALLAVQSLLPQPKDQDVLIDELGLEEGIKAFAQQQRMWASFGKALEGRQAEQAQHLESLKQSTIKQLSEKHGDKAASVFSDAVQYVASKTGADPKQVEALMAHPEAVEMVKDAMTYRELKSKEPDVKRTIAEKPKVTRPGAKVSAQATAFSATQTARAKLKSSGSLSDAVAYLQAQRKAKG